MLPLINLVCAGTTHPIQSQPCSPLILCRSLFWTNRSILTRIHGFQRRSSEAVNQLFPVGFFVKDGLTPPFPGTVIRCPLRNAPSGIIQVTSSREFISQELDISCLVVNNINIYDIASTGTHRRIVQKNFSCDDS
jgi:hypothetical protein